MSYLLLIKHSLPEIQEHIPAREWHLSEDGCLQCQHLAALIKPYLIQKVITSVEPKAVETGHIIAEQLDCPFSIEVGLHEHDRTNEFFLAREEFETMVQSFFETPSKVVMGRESAEQALSRFQTAVDDIVDRFPGENLAIVAHGTVISLFAARYGKMNAFLLWKQLELPSFIVFSMPEKQIVKLVPSLQEAKSEIEE